MKSEWKQVQLSDIADLTVGFVGTMAQHYVDDGIVFLRSTNIEPFKINFDDVKYISQEFNQKIKKSQLNSGDVVIVRTGKPGACAVIPKIENSWNCSDLVIIRPNQEKILPLYLAAYINLAYGVINAHLVGAVQQHFNVGSAKKLIIDLPPISTQKQIVGIIQAINDKIEVNQRINDNLEQQAKALYKTWFIDFALFDGMMPKDWQFAKLGDIASVSSGKRPPIRKAEKATDVYFPLIGAASIMGYTNTVLYDAPILVTGRVGTHGVVQRFQTPCWPSDNTLVITSRYYEFVYQVLQTVDYENMNRGSTQPLITQTDLKNVEIVLPPPAILEQFESLVGTLMQSWEANRIENEKLSILRDTLLLKLMSGEIDVSNI